MSGFPPPSNSLPPVNIGQSASTAGGGGSVDGSSAAGSTTTAGTSTTASAVPDMSSIVSGGGELYGNMMVGSLPAMGGGLGESAPPSPELGPVRDGCFFFFFDSLDDAPAARVRVYGRWCFLVSRVVGGYFTLVFVWIHSRAVLQQQQQR